MVVVVVGVNFYITLSIKCSNVHADNCAVAIPCDDVMFCGRYGSSHIRETYLEMVRPQTPDDSSTSMTHR